VIVSWCGSTPISNSFSLNPGTSTFNSKAYGDSTRLSATGWNNSRSA
jgi:hypothetical protein